MRKRSKQKAIITSIIVIAMMAFSVGNSAGSVPGMDTDLGDSFASFWGENDEDFSGFSVTGVGDVNGDGNDDIMIGAEYNDEGGTDAGQAYLIFGKATGWSMDIDLSSSDASFLGEDAGDEVGFVAGAGDVNGDGYDDILIGAPMDEEGGTRAGQTYLILGKSTGWSMDTDLSNSDASFVGEATGDYSGQSVAVDGDVNGDGYDDILIGAYRNSETGSGAGQTYLILGKASGWSMDTDLSNADASFLGEEEADYFGVSVTAGGDVNNDGYDDILIGAHFNDEGGLSAGQTYLVLGKASGWSMDTDLSEADASFWGEATYDWTGQRVAFAGDVNGDGFDDIMIGSKLNPEGGVNAGQTYVVYGKASGWLMDNNLSNADASFWGERSNDLSGSVAGAGDVNGDGYDDMLIGVFRNSEGGSQSGQTYLILGKVTGLSMDTRLSNSDASFIGEAAGDSSGWSVAGAGDVNGDGYDDILIGAPGDDDGGAGAGQTYLVLSTYGGPPIWSSIPVLNAVEDVPLTYDFSNNVSDPDTPNSILLITSSSPYVESIDGLNVTFRFPEGILSASLPLYLTDRVYGAFGVVEFTVHPVNDPPNHDLEGQQTAIEDEAKTIDLASHIWDVDNETNDLFLTVDSPYATIQGFNLTVLFPEGVLEHDLWINISDGLNLTEVKLHFTVTPVDDPPEVSDLGEFTAVEDQLSVFDLIPFLYDGDTPLEHLDVMVNDVNCTVEGQELHFLHSRGGVTYTISIEVADTQNRVIAELIVHVEEVNDPPAVAVILPRSLIEGWFEAINLTAYISDEDTPLDQLVLECTHPSVHGIDGLVIMMRYTTWQEDHTVDFVVFDGTTRTSGSFAVQVQAVNDPPEHDIPEQQTATADEPKTIDLASHVWDTDNELSELFLNVDSPYATAEGLVLTVLFPEGVLEHDLWLDVSDGINSTEVKLHFTITPVDHPPEISGLNLEDGQRVKDVISIGGNAFDDGTIVTVQARIDGGVWVDVEGTDSWTHELDTTSLTHGTHTVEIRGWDGQQWSDPVSVEFFVDQVPEVIIVTPEGMAKFKRAFEASGTASDDAEVIRVEFLIDEGEWIEADGTQEWNYDVMVKDLEEGEHTLEVRAFDGKQYSDTASVTFNVEKEEESPAVGLVGALMAILVAALVAYNRRMHSCGKGAS